MAEPSTERDETTLVIQVDNVSTYQTLIDDEAELHVKLEGILMGAFEGLLPVLRARRERRPLVVIRVVPAAFDPAPFGGKG